MLLLESIVDLDFCIEKTSLHLNLFADCFETHECSPILTMHVHHGNLT